MRDFMIRPKCSVCIILLLALLFFTACGHPDFSLAASEGHPDPEPPLPNDANDPHQETLKTRLQLLEATALEGLGGLHFERGENASAAECYRELAGLRWEQGDRWGEAWALTHLGQALEKDGAPEQAVAFYERSLTHSVELGDQEMVETAHRLLGMSALGASTWRDAERHLDASSLLLGERIAGTDIERHPLLEQLRATVNAGLAEARRQIARQRQALAMAEEQLADLRERRDLKGESHLLVRIAYLHQELGDHDEASRIFRKAQVLKQDLADVEGEVMALGGWIETLAALEDDTAALLALRRFVELLEASGERSVEALAWARLAAACSRLGDPDAAVEAAEKALALGRDDSEVEATALETLVAVHLTRGDEPSARRFAERLVRVARRHGDPVTEGRALRQLARSDLLRGDTTQALKRCAESRELARQAADLLGLQESERCPRLQLEDR